MDLNILEGNDKPQRQFRKYGNDLTVSGLGVIVFGLWSVLKVFAEMAFGSLDLRAFLMEGLEDTPQMRTLMYTVFFAVILFILVFHYYIGRCAIQVGTGRKKRYLYLLLTVLLLFVNLAGFERYFGASPDDVQLDITVASFLVDVANCWILIHLFRASVMYYHIGKKTGGA